MNSMNNSIMGSDFTARANKKRRLLPLMLVLLLSFGAYISTLNLTTELKAATATAFSLSVNGETDNVEVENNQAFTLQVEALDESLQTMEDYDGTITVSSSDNNATLPGEYTFKVSDAGIKTFDLGLKLTSPGDQTITVQDVDHPEVMGVITVSVQGGGSAVTDPDAPLIIMPTDNSTVNQNVLDIVGTATPNTEISIYDGSELLGTTESNQDGEYIFTTETLFTGSHIFTATAEGESGATLESNEVLVTVDDSAPVAVEGTVSPTTVEPSGNFTLTVSAEKELLQVTAVVDGRSELLVETPLGSGTYVAEMIAPDTAGRHPIDVELTDQTGNTEEYSDLTEIVVEEATVPNQAPTASPTFVPVSGQSPLTVNFSSNASDSDGQVVSYRWDFGDGGSSTEANPSHTYTYEAADGEPGKMNYQVSLTVTDDQGQSTTVQAEAVDIEGNKVSSVTVLSDVGPELLVFVLLALIGAYSYRRLAAKRQ